MKSDKNELLADLRNKLTPIKNYLAMQRKAQQPEDKSASKFAAFLDGYTSSTKQQSLNDEQINAERAFPQIEYIIELLEKLTP